MRHLALALSLIACTSSGEPPKAAAPPPVQRPAKVTDVTAEDFAAPSLPKARVTLTDAFGFKHAVDAEVAATRDARTRGLMWRSSLPEGTGMLFIFPAEEELNFWMKNTLIPLDLVFISKDRVIVGIVERAEPRTLSPRGPGRPATYVLEVPGGWAAKVGLKPGLKVQLDGISAIVPTD
jgi:uncharacterized protein